jgi:hypothetical protein
MRPKEEIIGVWKKALYPDKHGRPDMMVFSATFTGEGIDSSGNKSNRQYDGTHTVFCNVGAAGICTKKYKFIRHSVEQALNRSY